MLSRAQEDRTLCLGALEPPGNCVPEVSGLRVKLTSQKSAVLESNSR